MKDITFGRLLAVAGTILLAPDAVCIKSLSVHPLWKILLRNWVCFGSTTAVYLAIYRGNLLAKVLELLAVPRFMFLSLIFLISNDYCWVLALNSEDVATVLLIYSANVLLVGILSHFIFSDKLTAKQGICIFVGLCGIGVCFVPDIRAQATNVGIIWAIGMCLSATFYWIFIRKLGQSGCDPGLIEIFHFASNSILPLLFCSDDQFYHFSLADDVSMKDWMVLTVTALFLPSSFVLFALAPKYTHPAEVSLISLGEIIISSFLAFILFGEVPELWTWVGGGMLLTTIAGFVLYEPKVEKELIEREFLDSTIQ